VLATDSLKENSITSISIVSRFDRSSPALAINEQSYNSYIRDSGLVRCQI
jgi:hypothetical protein